MLRCKHLYLILGRDLCLYYMECKNCSHRRIIWKPGSANNLSGKRAMTSYWDERSNGSHSAWKNHRTNNIPSQDQSLSEQTAFKYFLINPLDSKWRTEWNGK
jgi:hypothetical protein